MNSIVSNKWNSMKRRLILALGIMVAIGTTVFAYPKEEAKLTKEEAQELIKIIKEELDIDQTYQPEFIFDEEGLMEEVGPLTIIRIFDSKDELLLEAPITKLRQFKNKHLRRLLNASDYLIQYGSTKYYRLDL